MALAARLISAIVVMRCQSASVLFSGSSLTSRGRHLLGTDSSKMLVAFGTIQRPTSSRIISLMRRNSGTRARRQAALVGLGAIGVRLQGGEDGGKVVVKAAQFEDQSSGSNDHRHVNVHAGQ